MHMPVVKINAIEVPPDAGPELEKRFANRAHAVDNQPGFLGFQLLRPIKGETRYFVVTHWASATDFEAWVNSPAFGHGHAGPPAGPGHWGPCVFPSSWALWYCESFVFAILLARPCTPASAKPLPNAKSAAP